MGSAIIAKPLGQNVHMGAIVSAFYGSRKPFVKHHLPATAAQLAHMKKTKREQAALELWSRILEAMEAAGIESQADLARKLGITSQAISSWKRGASRPAREHYNALSLWSGLTPGYIEFDARPKYLPQTDLQDRVIAALNLLPEESQKRIADQAEFEVWKARVPKSE